MCPHGQRGGEGTGGRCEDPAEKERAGEAPAPWQAMEEAAAGHGGFFPGVSVARSRAGTQGRRRTRAPCVCFVRRDDSRHMILTQTETVQKDTESGWLLMLKTQPCVSFCASSMKTLPAAVLDSHHAWYRCSGHRARGILVAGILMKFSFKTNKHNSLLKSRDAEIVIL